MKRSAATARNSDGQWTFVARKTTGRGGLSVQKVAVSELARPGRGKSLRGARVRLDAPELATRLTRAFQSAVKRVKRAKRQDPVRA